MEIARTLPELTQARAKLPPELALVPTMGALHEGHISLVRTGLAQAGCVAASIFVNPLQFNAAEDLARYPRTEDQDLAMLQAAGCSLVWMPDAASMYPTGSCTTIDVEGPSSRWEGPSRPGHFRGVATVVAKLFGQVRPGMALFGEKDWQQLQVIRRMVADLLLPVRVQGVKTIREADGLAMSSRNRFLAPEERAKAPILFQSLSSAAAQIQTGQPVAAVLQATRQILCDAGFEPDYLEAVHAETLEPLHKPGQARRLLAAAKLGTVRLLDNVSV